MGRATIGSMKASAVGALLLSLWSITVPSLGRRLGLGVEVPAKVEVVDHVIPGIAAAIASIVALALLRRRSGDDIGLLLAAGVVALSGLWMTTTHLPLVVQAGQGIVPWPAAIWHSAAGPVILGLGVALFAMRPEGTEAGAATPS